MSKADNPTMTSHELLMNYEKYEQMWIDRYGTRAGFAMRVVNLTCPGLAKARCTRRQR